MKEYLDKLKKNPAKPIGIGGLVIMFIGYIFLVTKPTEGTSHRQMMGVGIIIIGGLMMIQAVMIKSNKNITDAITSAAASQKPAA